VNKAEQPGVRQLPDDEAEDADAEPMDD